MHKLEPEHKNTPFPMLSTPELARGFEDAFCRPHYECDGCGLEFYSRPDDPDPAGKAHKNCPGRGQWERKNG
jgi:hypothetical protein